MLENWKWHVILYSDVRQPQVSQACMCLYTPVFFLCPITVFSLFFLDNSYSCIHVHKYHLFTNLCNSSKILHKMIISRSLYNIWYASRSGNIYWEPVLLKALCQEQRVTSALQTGLFQARMQSLDLLVIYGQCPFRMPQVLAVPVC